MASATSGGVKEGVIKRRKNELGRIVLVNMPVKM
jgi:hypothetical protein